MWHRALVAMGWGQCSEGEPLLWRPQPSPPSLGLSLDRSRLHLLYRAPPAATWDDITAQVALELTHLYARFQVTHFSWYWLWYTTKACVGHLAGKAWRRLRLHHVNLIALQRRRDPEQILLQCLPRSKVGPGRGLGGSLGVPSVGS